MKKRFRMNQNIKYRLRILKINYFKEKKILRTLKNYSSIKFIGLNKEKGAKGSQIERCFREIKIPEVGKEEQFVYFIDEKIKLVSEKTILGNLSVDYTVILEKGIYSFKAGETVPVSEFDSNYFHVLNGIEDLCTRIIEKVNKSDCTNREKIVNSFRNMLKARAQSFYDALQRILFYNQLLWQTQHPLIGLGRLDYILEPYFYKDIHSGTLTKEEAMSYMEEFIRCLHKNYLCKSNGLIGDTGQIIILGGIGEEGSYFCNELTYLFIDIIRNFQSPDPKILLRVSTMMPRQLLKKALECIATGIGCPLLANDDVIIPLLKEFGYGNDSYHYITSACWEILIPGKAMDQNNVASINYMLPLENALKRVNDGMESFHAFISQYEEELKIHIALVCEKARRVNWEKDPLLSLFFPGCSSQKKDLSEGGAEYNDIGITTVALMNTVKALLNIKKYVFEQKVFSLKELKQALSSNFEDRYELLERLKHCSDIFTREDDIIEIINDIAVLTSQELKNKNNSMGGRIKYGFSSPDYINQAIKFPASLDGRRSNEPFDVHISLDEMHSYTELLNIASHIMYMSNGINGNVVDFFVTPQFLTNNIEKFTDFIFYSMEKGFFQLQMNVVSYSMLIEAKKKSGALS